MCSTVDQEDLEMKGSAFSNIGIEIIFLFCQISLARARRFIRAGSARKGYPFEKGCRKKSTKVDATRPKGGLGINWYFTYWSKGNLQVYIFAREEFVFHSEGFYL